LVVRQHTNGPAIALIDAADFARVAAELMTFSSAGDLALLSLLDELGFVAWRF
jgi:hypothetical protein